MTPSRPAPIDAAHPMRQALDAAEPRPAPTADRGEKKNYAERLSRELALLFGQALRGKYPTVTPSEAGGQESPVGAARGRKRLDVKVWDDHLGLVLDLSVKTYSFQDYSPTSGKLGRFTKNILRNDHELRAEADVVHRRQPYSVLVAVMFMNREAAFDAHTTHSSFAHAAFTLSKRTGRTGPDDPRFDLFERVFIGLYEPEGVERGSVVFFDVANPPPRSGLPQKRLTLAELLEEIDKEVRQRNRPGVSYEDGEVIAADEFEASQLDEDDE